MLNYWFKNLPLTKSLTKSEIFKICKNLKVVVHLLRSLNKNLNLFKVKSQNFKSLFTFYI